MRTFFQIHIDNPPGDVLIFLPGQEDIESLEASIKLYANQLPVNHPAVRSFLVQNDTTWIGKLNKTFFFLTAGTDMYHVRCSRAFAEQQSFHSYSLQYPKVYSRHKYR